jgi:hypothetical protein
VDAPVMGGRLNPGRLLCDNYHVLREVVLQADMVCICTRDFVAQDLAEGRVREIQIPDMLPPASTIYAAKLRGRIASPLATAAIQRVRAALRRAASGPTAGGASDRSRRRAGFGARSSCELRARKGQTVAVCETSA